MAAPLLSLVTLIRANTARSDVVAMASEQDPHTSRLVGFLPEQLDRSILLTDTVPDSSHPVPAPFFLSPARLDGNKWSLVGQTSDGPLSSLPILRRVSEWYMSRVSRRKPAELLDLVGTYYLYRAPQKLAAARRPSSHDP
jgi:hypothetical protein